MSNLLLIKDPFEHLKVGNIDHDVRIVVIAEIDQEFKDKGEDSLAIYLVKLLSLIFHEIYDDLVDIGLAHDVLDEWRDVLLLDVRFLTFEEDLVYLFEEFNDGHFDAR